MEKSEYKEGTDYVSGIRILQVLVELIWIRELEREMDDVWYEFSFQGN